MSSLHGAPTLGGGAKRPFSFQATYGDGDDDDDYIALVSSEGDIAPQRSRSGEGGKSSKKGKKDKEGKRPKSKKRDSFSGKESKERGRDADDHYSSSTGNKKSSSSSSKHVTTAEEDAPAENYEDDFDDYEDDFDEQPLDSDDYIPQVVASPNTKTPRVDYSNAKANSELKAKEDRAAEAAEQQIRAEREEHERNVKRWQDERVQQEAEMARKQADLEKQISALQKQQQSPPPPPPQPVPSAPSLTESDIAKIAQQLASVTGGQQREAPVDEQVTASSNINAEGSSLTEAQRAELQRRRRRERERAVSLRRAEEEDAARTLFQRLAQDVREVFHELNLAVVAAEKERLIKDERYRKEREMKDRREEMERTEKLQKELKEREEREEKFWSQCEQREDKFRTFLEDRARKDEEEREARLRRDLEDRATRSRNERELRDELDRVERERRERAESGVRERDTTLLQGQLEEVKLQYRAQVEEVRRQVEIDRAHAEEMHKSEIHMAERRHEAALEQLRLQHAQQLELLQGHISNAGRLEKLIEQVHQEMGATKALTENLTDERLAALRTRERELEDQKAVVNAVLDDVKRNAEELEKERARITGLYAKFEIALAGYTRSAEEDRRRFQEAQAHQDTLRQQAEKDRRLMLSEVAQERKVLEQQHEEFIAKKVESMNELQTERVAIARDRTEAAMMRERQNRDETELLRSLRVREEEYSAKVEGIEGDRAAAAELRSEQQRLYEAAMAEREALRKERQAFELEKTELLSRFESIRQRAEDAAGMQDRLRRELVEHRASSALGFATGAGAEAGAVAVHSDPQGGQAAASRLQMDLAKQRAILQRISGH